MSSHPCLPPAELESVCRVLADTTGGLTGTEIGNLLAQLDIPDPAAGITKWRRLLAALSEQQRHDGCSNNVLRFILQDQQGPAGQGPAGDQQSQI